MKRKSVKRISLTQAAAIAGRHPDTIVRRFRRGLFPQPLEKEEGLPTHGLEFDEAEVLAYVAQERRANREQAAPRFERGNGAGRERRAD